MSKQGWLYIALGAWGLLIFQVIIDCVRTGNAVFPVMAVLGAIDGLRGLNPKALHPGWNPDTFSVVRDAPQRK